MYVQQQQQGCCGNQGQRQERASQQAYGCGHAQCNCGANCRCLPGNFAPGCGANQQQQQRSFVTYQARPVERRSIVHSGIYHHPFGVQRISAAYASPRISNTYPIVAQPVRTSVTAVNAQPRVSQQSRRDVNNINDSKFIFSYNS